MLSPKLLSLLFLISFIKCDCVHDEFIKNTTVHLYDDFTQRRMLQTSSIAGPLRVFVDYTQMSAGTLEDKNYIRRIMNITANYFYNVLTVQRLDRLFFPSTSNQQCNIVRVPDIYVTQGTIGDVGVVVGSENVSLQYVAKSSPCVFLSTNKRPTWGVVIWNIRMLKKGSTQGFQEILFVGLHEMTHILAFSALMYQTFPSGSMLGSSPAGDYYLKSSNLTNEVKNYFGCQNSLGLDLQDQDGTLIGSHWEKHHVGNQFMISSNSKQSYISRFTLAIFASTGWYPSVNFSFAQPMTWGRNKGCNFLNIDNCDSDEFCNDNSFNCDWDATGIGRCEIDPFTGSCKMQKHFTNTICIDENYEIFNLNAQLQANERGGHNSRCFRSNYRKTGALANALNNRCYITVCSFSGSFLYLLVGSSTLICRTPNQIIPALPGLEGELTCPSDFSLICGGKKTCPFNCNSNGACINGRCLCNGATQLTPTCSNINMIRDPETSTGGRILYEQMKNKMGNRKKSIRREYSMQNLCKEGEVFDPIGNTCQSCLQLLGCSKCNQRGCLKQEKKGPQYIEVQDVLTEEAAIG